VGKKRQGGTDYFQPPEKAHTQKVFDEWWAMENAGIGMVSLAYFLQQNNVFVK
jgi:hypothetical protein